MNAIEQAKIIYPLLLSKVKSKDTITYGEINSALGYKGNASGHAIRPGMDLIVLYCKEAGYPQLTSLIVNKSSGVPTDGYAYGDGEDNPDEHSKCFKHTHGKNFLIIAEFGTEDSRYEKGGDLPMGIQKNEVIIKIRL